MNLPAMLEKALSLSTADGCVAIGRRGAEANVRWARGGATTNGFSDEAEIAIVSVRGRKVASVRSTVWSEDQVAGLVRSAEAACETRPDAQDWAPLVEPDGKAAGWDVSGEFEARDAFGGLVPRLARVLKDAGSAGIELFGYATSPAPSVWVGTSTGVRAGHSRVRGSVVVTAKTRDFGASAWAGATSHDIGGIDVDRLYEKLRLRLEWSKEFVPLPPGRYEVILEPQAVADMLLYLYISSAARDADEGRSAFSRPGGGNRVGEQLYSEMVDLYSDPAEPGLEDPPFVATSVSTSYFSVFDNGFPLTRVNWVERGVLRGLIAPRWWAAKTGAAPAPYIWNLVLPGRADGPWVDELIASTERALLVTRFWYIRMLDPQTLLLTGLTRDGVFLVEDGRVRGVTNNFRFNHSPVEMLASVVEAGPAEQVVPNQMGSMRVPPLRVRGFHMSSVSEAV